MIKKDKKKNQFLNFLNSTSVRLVHGYVVRRFKPKAEINNKLRDVRCGLVYAIYFFLRLETLQKFRRLRKVDMYRRRTYESREPIFILGTLLSSTRSTRDNETGISIAFMDKWRNRFQFDFRSSASNFLGIARWDLRSFFRSYPFYLGRRNGHKRWLLEALKKRPGRFLV